MFNFLKNLLQLIISPGKGWEDISLKGDNTATIINKGAYPLFLIAALSSFFVLMYDTDVSIIMLIQKAIITFVQFFVSVFFAKFVFSFRIDKYVIGEPDEKRYSTYIIYGVSLVSLITIIKNIIPIQNIALIDFLPVFVALIMWKGCQYMAIREDKTGHFMIFTAVTVIFPPMLLNMLFNGAL